MCGREKEECRCCYKPRTPPGQALSRGFPEVHAAECVGTVHTTQPAFHKGPVEPKWADALDSRSNLCSVTGKIPKQDQT